MEIIGINEIMKLLGISRELATQFVILSGAALPRAKGKMYRVRRDTFLKWWDSYSGGTNQ